MANENFQQVFANSLAQLARMYAYNIVNNEDWKDKSNGEKIVFLNQMGFTNNDIASIVGTSPGTVSKEISTRKKKV